MRRTSKAISCRARSAVPLSRLDTVAMSERRRSTARPSLPVSTARTVPIAVRRKTGAIASWMTWAMSPRGVVRGTRRFQGEERLLGLDAGGFADPAELGDFAFYVSGELLGRAGRNLQALRAERGLHVLPRQHLDRFRVQPADDGGRRCRGREQAEPR